MKDGGIKMDYINLGKSGLNVSRLSFGSATFDGKTINQATAQKMVDMAIDAGVNFFDTANVYQGGVSEEMLGKALKNKRDKYIIASKVYHSVNNTKPHEALGYSRRGIIQEVEKSLKRLDTDYIDLYQLHGFDNNTPIEEVLSTLNDLVRSGKIRYIGLSNFTGWQLAKAQMIADKHGFEKFISSQNQYSLVTRDLEYEILPACRDLDIGVTVWSPLAGGFLTGKYTKDGDLNGRRAYFPMPPVDSRYGYDVVDKVKEIAKKHNATAAQISNAWLLHQEGISSVIMGVSKLDQLEENLKSIDIKLTKEDLEELHKVSQPAYIYPHWTKLTYTDRGILDPKASQSGIEALQANKRNSMITTDKSIYMDI